MEFYDVEKHFEEKIIVCDNTHFSGDVIRTKSVKEFAKTVTPKSKLYLDLSTRQLINKSEGVVNILTYIGDIYDVEETQEEKSYMFG